MKLILNRKEYLQQREEYVNQMMLLKKSRSIIGDQYSIYFENYDTIRYQIQEVLLLEDSYDNAQEEIDAYSDLLPKQNELSLTFSIEIIDILQRNKFLNQSSDLLNHIYLLDEKNVRINSRQVDHEKISCVNFLKFSIIENKKYNIICNHKNMEFNHLIPVSIICD